MRCALRAGDDDVFVLSETKTNFWMRWRQVRSAEVMIGAGAQSRSAEQVR
jgi:hypothetical protein